MDPEPTPPPASDPATPAPRLLPTLALYTAARLVLIVVLYLLLALVMVPLVALAFAVVLQLPLAWLLFAPLRRRLNAALAVSRARTRQERADLRRALAGDES